MQKGGGYSDVRIPDLYVIDKVHNRSPFSLVYLMIHTMRNTGCDTIKKRVFHYPILLTRVFQDFSVDFTGGRRESNGRS